MTMSTATTRPCIGWSRGWPSGSPVGHAAGPSGNRLTWAVAASQCGAALANYVEAAELLRAGDRVEGVRAVDRMTPGDMPWLRPRGTNLQAFGRVAGCSVAMAPVRMER